MIRYAPLATIAVLAIAPGALANPTAIGGGITITLSRPGTFPPPSRGSHFTPFPNPCTDAPIHCRPNPCHRPCNGWSNGPAWGAWGWNSGCWSDWNSQTLVVIDVPSNSAATEPITIPTLPQPDPAMLALRAGRYAEAASAFLRAHDERRIREAQAVGEAIPDRSALRLHALALAGAGDFAAAAAAFATAHREDPALGADPIDGDRVLPSRAEARRIMLGASRFARRTGAADAWAMVGYLTQVEGRHDLARSFLARAQDLRIAVADR
jgi:hypothetical protein